MYSKKVLAVSMAALCGLALQGAQQPIDLAAWLSQIKLIVIMEPNLHLKIQRSS